MGKINRRSMCTYVEDDVDVYVEKFDEDKLSFFKFKGIAKKYGYTSWDLVYYLHPSIPRMV
jgi:hypothetical protein